MSENIKALDKPLTVPQLRTMQLDGDGITAVVSVQWDRTGEIDNLNEIASEAITGDEYALVDIGYRLVGADVEKQEILLEVTGSIEDDWWEDQGYFDDSQGYCVVDETLYHRMYPNDSLGEFDDTDEGYRFVPSKFLLELPADCHRLVDAWTKNYIEKMESEHGNG